MMPSTPYDEALKDQLTLEVLTAEERTLEQRKVQALEGINTSLAVLADAARLEALGRLTTRSEYSSLGMVRQALEASQQLRVVLHRIAGVAQDPDLAADLAVIRQKELATAEKRQADMDEHRAQEAAREARWAAQGVKL